MPNITREKITAQVIETGKADAEEPANDQGCLVESVATQANQLNNDQEQGKQEHPKHAGKYISVISICCNVK